MTSKMRKYTKQLKYNIYNWATQKNQVPIKSQLWTLIKQMALMTLAILLFVIIMYIISIKKASAEVISTKPERGWFWYEDPIRKETQKPEQAKEQQKEPEKTVKETPKKDKDFEFPVKEDAPEVVRQWLKEPTEENAKAFLAWQYKYIEHLKKIGYSLRNAYLRYGDEIYPIAGYPESPLASVYYHNVKDSIYKSLIEKASNKLGLIYFYSKSCPNCNHQKPILSYLASKYNISIRGVTVDGDIDADLPFPSVYNPILIKKYQITSVPTILAVMDKGSNEQPAIAGISAGFTPLDQIEQQIIRFLIQEGEIKEKELRAGFVVK